MANRTINLKELSVQELKAMAYDQMASIENAQRILQALNGEITERANQPQATPQEQVEPAKE